MLSCQISQHSFASLFGCSERFERRTDDLNGGPVLIDRTPRGYEAWGFVQAGTASALKADHERNTVAGRGPDLHLLNGINDAAELRAAPQLKLPPVGSVGSLAGSGLKDMAKHYLHAGPAKASPRREEKDQ